MRLKVLNWFIVKYAEIREHHSLHIFGRLLDDPYLFHLNRRSVSGAFAVGFFSAWIPMPFQMLIAAFIATAVRVNLPLSVLLVWVTNPVTMTPMFYSAYIVGTWLTGDSAGQFQFEPSYEWFVRELQTIGEPFLIGCLVLATASSVTGFFMIKLLWSERFSRLLHIRLKRYRRRKKHEGNNLSI